MEPFINLDRFHTCLENCRPMQVHGKVSRVVGFMVESVGPECRMGTVCDIYDKDGSRKFPAEVMGFKDNRVLLMPLEEIQGIGPGSRVVARQTQAYVPVGNHLLGRIIDGIGNPIDGKGPIHSKVQYPIYATPINPLKRRRISEPLDLGIRAINGLLTVGCGQRMGIFAGSGVGKSVLLGMIAKKTDADVNVIALIGERGRELNDFIEKQLGEDGLHDPSSWSPHRTTCP